MLLRRPLQSHGTISQMMFIKNITVGAFSFRKDHLNLYLFANTCLSCWQSPQGTRMVSQQLFCNKVDYFKNTFLRHFVRRHHESARLVQNHKYQNTKEQISKHKTKNIKTQKGNLKHLWIRSATPSPRASILEATSPLSTAAVTPVQCHHLLLLCFPTSHFVFFPSTTLN